ncbi:hypothetical protein CO670_32080 [Rhizobium sp. J15]|uniref:hypothetical protein n=1 Tax=Rhizobium sp. J15 TaxID=2035450 RepID=UPI000BE820ED|nr:hypothetical protein [Rhizobium sp. J15]PDT09045.1 hypothetical protein CO670_32080 [Rhizobium sp. J15]
MLGYTLLLVISFTVAVVVDFLFFGGGHWAYCIFMVFFALAAHILIRVINPDYERNLVRRFGKDRSEK